MNTMNLRLKAGCELCFESETPTPFVLMLRPRSGNGQWIAEERYTLMPMVSVGEYVDSYGEISVSVCKPRPVALLSRRKSSARPPRTWM